MKKHDEIISTNRFSDKENSSNNSGDRQNRNNIKEKRVNTIIGDSIIKEIKPHKMKFDLEPDDKIYIKSFPGATVECMKDYVKPTLRHNPDLIIVHAGTNNLRTEQTSEQIAEQLLNLAADIETDTNEVIMSSITVRKDKYNAKGQKVNFFLKTLCSENSIKYIDNSAIIDKYLNGGGVHLNYNGTSILANNIIDMIRL